MSDPGVDSVDPDRIVVALSSIALGALTGGALMTAGTLVVRTAGPEAAGPESAGFMILSAAVALGFGAAVVVAFGASRPVSNLWRRAVIAAIAFFGAAVLSVLAAPIDMFAGAVGLVGWLGLLTGLWLWALRTWRRVS